MYEIGEKIWFKGDECEIVSEPYASYGGTWQDAKKESGEIISVITPEEKNKQVKKHQKEYSSQQEGFRRLRENKTG